MTNSEIAYLVMLERRRDELAAAEQSRLVKAAFDARKQNRAPRPEARAKMLPREILRSAGHALTWLGLKIQEWGSQLQVRYTV